MPAPIIRFPTQPFLRLAHANVELLIRFALSPEVVSQSLASGRCMFLRTQESAMSLAQSSAFAQLTQGMLKNYTACMMEVVQSGMALLAQDTGDDACACAEFARRPAFSSSAKDQIQDHQHKRWNP